MREYKKISKGIIILITCVIIITSISFIALFVSRKEEPKGNGKQLAGTVNYLEESNSIEEVSSTSDKTINEVKDIKIENAELENCASWGGIFREVKKAVNVYADNIKIKSIILAQMESAVPVYRK